LSRDKGAVLLSIDLEHVGVGIIVQLSVIAVDPSTFNIVLEMFDEYVKPTANAALWDSNCMDVHDIRPHQKRIKDADGVGGKNFARNSLVTMGLKIIGTTNQSWWHGEERHVIWNGYSR
jgi:hypothetical protein